MKYICIVLNKEGKTNYLYIESPSWTRTKAELLNDGFIVKYIFPDLKSILLSIPLAKRIKNRDLSSFFEELSFYVAGSGLLLSLANMLEVYSYDSKRMDNEDFYKYINRIFKNYKYKSISILISKLLSEATSGKNLIDIFKDHTLGFPEEVVAILSAAEKEGDIERGFQEISNYYKSVYSYKKKLSNVMVYPALLILLMIIAAVIFIYYVAPKFMSFIKNIKYIKPPLVLTLIISIKPYVPVISLIAFGALLSFFTLFFIDYKGLKSKIYEIISKLPVVSEVINSSYLSILFYQLYILTKGGVTVIESFKIIKEHTRNLYWKKNIGLLIKDLETGKSLSCGLKRLDINPLVSTYISAGEKTGKIDETFDRLKNRYKELSDDKINFFVSFITYSALFITAGFIIFFFLNLYLPLIGSLVNGVK
ncbi:MAG: type II secretion system F family protein [bacterium]